MVTLIIEIVLTVAAWRSGWGPRALLPLGVMLPSAFATGLVIGAAGGPQWLILPLGLGLDLACIGVLLKMASVAPRPAGLAAAFAAPAAAPGERGAGAS